MEFGYLDASGPRVPAVRPARAVLPPGALLLALAVADVAREHGGLPQGECDPVVLDALMDEMTDGVPAYGQ